MHELLVLVLYATGGFAWSRLVRQFIILAFKDEYSPPALTIHMVVTIAGIVVFSVLLLKE